MSGLEVFLLIACGSLYGAAAILTYALYSLDPFGTNRRTTECVVLAILWPFVVLYLLWCVVTGRG